MSVTVGVRSLFGFAVGVAMAVVALVVFQALTADAAPGDTDATLVPITPCRLIDTRPGDGRVGPHAAFGVGDTKTIAAHGTNGKCTVPSDAVGLSLNVTAVGATAPSFVTIWPAGDLPKASSLNPAPGQPPTPNAVTTTLSGTGSFKMFNKAGSVDVIVDVNGYYTKTSLQELTSRIAALEAGSGTDPTVLARITALEAENAELKALTASMSLATVDGKNTVRFSGVNVQIVSGSGATKGLINGTGNLIVGYNENSSDIRTGSHNLIVGPYHSYSSYGGFIAGYNNTASGAYSSVSGGSNNTASSTYSSVSGGYNNTASNTYSSVSGGYNNTASGIAASVSGGWNRSAAGSYDWAAGGLSEGS